MDNPLSRYLKTLTPEQREQFADAAGSSPASLRLAAKGYKTEGCLSLTPEFAARLEKASGGALSRSELSPVCCDCPFAKCVTKKK